MGVVGLGCLPYLYATMKLYFVAQAYKPEYEWPQLTELWKTVVSGIGFLLA